MKKVFVVMMYILEGLLAAGCIGLAFLETGIAPKVLYVLGAVLLIPIPSLREKAAEKIRLPRTYIIPAIGLVLVIIAIMMTPVN